MQNLSQIHYGFTVGFRYAAIILFAFTCVGGSVANAKTGEVLSSADVRLYQAAVAAHQTGDYKQADAYVNQTDNNLLAGYMLADKYFSPKYQTEAAEIEQWFQLYGSLPIADRMRKLGMRKKAKLPALSPKKIDSSVKCDSVRRDEALDLIRKRSFNELSDAQKSQARVLFADLGKLLADGKTLTAKNKIDSSAFRSVLSPADRALARTALAFSYFLDGEYALGEDQIQTALRSDSSALPLTYYIGGLIEWQLKNYQKAATYFSKAAQQKESYPLIHAAASFWAARTYLKIGKYERVGPYLEAAAQHPDTFYGMLALQLMGLDINTAWSVSAVEKTPDKTVQEAVNRFYALRQIGWEKEATDELIFAFQNANSSNRKVLLNIAREYQLDKKLQGGQDSSAIDKGSYPLPNWKPDNGWLISKALIYAIVRQESCFNPQAKSVRGARGVMQIMPATAEIMARRANLPWHEDKLEDISYNLALGQKYVQYLLNLPAVNNNIIYMAVAYNAGPANLIKWKKKMDYPADPLIFIERIPSRETRAFVERILSNFWVYQSLLGQENKTAEQMVRGKWPLAGRISSKKK